uniref:DUF4503 domain-containing protein n=1 Tax=Meleagris gallopavo TaxID=9103 RepID=G1NE10_MELGA
MIDNFSILCVFPSSFAHFSGLLYCSQCSEVVISPVLKMQLEIFLSCPSQPQSTVKVKLLQRTISSLLMSAANVDGVGIVVVGES